ncbi:DUF4123 domain-containing protein [Stenotrophomonas sp.]|uniref:DUF4123 domain-containing protein n=1 Tax=Stenotrophomonas sp. TaxID=69392 RepID=UPI0028ABCB38|nr:DUF4123 domain-containing protein [Stenotrophomonas sp.]
MAEESGVVQMGHREFLACDYALLNPMQLEKAQWADLPSVELKPAGLNMPAGILPRLVDLKALNEDQRIALLARSADWQRLNKQPMFGALLSTQRDAGTVQKHLCTQMVLKRDRKYWLRLHDPRVFASLERVLADTQLRRLFGPIDVWTWFEPFRAEWRYCRKPDRPRHTEPFQLNSEQWNALKRSPLLNRCLRKLSRCDGVAEDYQVVAPRVDFHLSSAAELGLNDRDDACLYALSIEKHGLDWLMLPRVQEAIDGARRGEQTFVRALADEELLPLPASTV